MYVDGAYAGLSQGRPKTDRRRHPGVVEVVELGKVEYVRRETME